MPPRGQTCPNELCPGYPGFSGTTVPPARPHSFMSSEGQLYNLECELIALAAGAALIAFVLRRLRRSMPGIAIGKAIRIAFGVRVLAAFLLNQTPIAGQLRGGDEIGFIDQAQSLARWDLLSHGDGP